MKDTGVILKHVCTIVLVAIISACTSKGLAPVMNRSIEKKIPARSSAAPSIVSKPVERTKPVRNDQGFYIVKKGDTLYSIAWNYGFDFRDVAVWNDIDAPYLIYPRQVIRLKPSGVKKKTIVRSDPVISKIPESVVEKHSVKPSTSKPKKIAISKKQKINTSASQNRKIVWQWPAKGRIIKSRSLTSKKGVNIAGRLGQDVKAAAQGDVVYSGSGLLGYGHLIIIKHSETFLSAYAHNSELLVEEGDSVGTGQLIAKMGSNSSGQAQLHFEIRKNGKSVNPLTFLPKS